MNCRIENSIDIEKCLAPGYQRRLVRCVAIENSIDIEKCLAQNYTYTLDVDGGGSLENSIDIEKCLAHAIRRCDNSEYI